MQPELSHPEPLRSWQPCLSNAVGAKIVVAASYRNTPGAKALAKLTGADVADLLQGQPRPSQYWAKNNGKGLGGEEFLLDEVQLCKKSVIVDDVVGTGATAKAAIHAAGVTCFFAYAGDEGASCQLLASAQTA